MKENAIIFVDANGDSAGFVLKAAARNGQSVWMAKAGREAFNILRDELHHAAAIVVDLDAGAHGFAVLEAVQARSQRPKVIVLTGAEEAYMTAVAAQHGADACLGKPFTVERLTATLRGLVPPARENLSCDLWGHPITLPQAA